MKRVFLTLGFAGALAFSGFSAAAVETGRVGLELNKLEPRDGSCRAYLIIENGTPSPFESLKLDLVMFDTDGIVAKRIAVEAGPFAASKTVLKVFNISQVNCDSLSRILLNDIPACADASGERTDCVAAVDLSSKSDVAFIK